MRKVIYFNAGTVADFVVPESLFEQFSRHMPIEKRYSEDEIRKAQKVLEAFMTQGGAMAGPNERLAACFIWNFFNTNPEKERHIDGDIMIVDLKGDGNTIEYASPDDVDMREEKNQQTQC